MIEVALADGSLVLVVRNDVRPGDPAPADRPAPGSGLGSSIVEMLVQQMSGRLEVERTDGTYAVHIEVPIS